MSTLMRVFEVYVYDLDQDEERLVQCEANNEEHAIKIAQIEMANEGVDRLEIRAVLMGGPQ